MIRVGGADLSRLSRTKLAACSDGAIAIETIRGVGYRLQADLHGDLDPATARSLDRLARTGAGRSVPASSVRPGTLPQQLKLYEEHGFAAQKRHLGEPRLWPQLLARWELQLLAELGFGLDLERCAASGNRRRIGIRT